MARAKPKPTEVHYQITAGLRFRGIDAYALRELAKRDWTHDADERGVFERAAEAAENGTVLIVQAMTRPELEEIVALFPRVGIRAPMIEPVRVSAPHDMVSKKFKERKRKRA